jgi:hypothetical protein
MPPKLLVLDSYILHVRLVHYSGWSQLCVHAQLCLQGLGAAACLLCMLGAVIIFHSTSQPGTEMSHLLAWHQPRRPSPQTEVGSIAPPFEVPMKCSKTFWKAGAAYYATVLRWHTA